MRVGVLTGGGDCPGLNAVIRAVVRTGVAEHETEFIGFRDGWRGPLEGDTMALDVERRARHPAPRRHDPRLVADESLAESNASTAKRGSSGSGRTWTSLGVDALVAIGGEDTLGVAEQAGRGRRQGRGRAEDDRQRPWRYRSAPSVSTPR